MRKVIISISNLNIPNDYSSILVRVEEYSMQLDNKVFDVGMMTERQDGLWGEMSNDDKQIQIREI